MSFKISFTRAEGRSGRLLLFAAAAAAMVAAVRWAALPPMLPDLDAVNFSRALNRFDLAAQAPHFPGYPVYVAMARLVAWAGAGEVLALALPGLALGALAVVALVLVLRRHLARPGVVAAAILWTLLPMPVLFGATPG